MSKKKPTPEEVVLKPEEQELEDALEAAHAAGKIDEIPIDQDYLSAVARNTLRKTERINIRFTAADLRAVKLRAAREGIPYQTLISSVIHKYVTGEL